MASVHVSVGGMTSSAKVQDGDERNCACMDECIEQLQELPPCACTVCVCVCVCVYGVYGVVLCSVV